MNDKAEAVFVIGASRSGTTMTGRILNKHSSVFTFNELHFYEQLWKEADETKVLGQQQAIDLLNTLFSTQRDGYFYRKADSKYSDESEIILSQFEKSQLFYPHLLYKAFLKYEANKFSKFIACEQTPRNVYYVDKILNHFTNPKFIHIIRDPRDVFMSQKNRWKRRKFSGNNVPLHLTTRQWINYHPITIGKLWVGANKISRQYKGNSSYYLIRYEDLLAEPEQEIKNICRFIGIHFSIEMIQIPHIGSSLREDKPGQLGIDKSKISGWKKGGLSPTELYICQRICKNIMKENGYEIEKVHPNLFLLLYYYGIFPLMGLLAIVFSFSKIKNLRETIKRRLF